LGVAPFFVVAQWLPSCALYLLGGLPLEMREHRAVRIERHADGLVAQPFLHRPRVNRFAQENGGVVVTREIHKKRFGLVCAALSVAEEIGLVEVIDRHVPKRRQGLSVGQYILIAVLNKIAHPTSRNGIRDWIQRTVLPEKLGIDPGLLRSQNFWDNFDLILSEEDVRTQKERLARAKIDEDELFSDEVILKIEEGIWERVCERYQIPLDCVLYDTTNFFTFISSGTDSFLARTGRNKHGRHNLRQVGLALAVIQGCQLPFLHLLYHGRRSDAKLFPEAMTDLVSRYLALSKGVRRLTVVFDKGNNSRANLQRASELNLRVVGSLVPAHHQDLVRVSLDRYVQIEGRLCYVTRKEVFGIPAKVVVSYNEATYRRQSRRLKAKVAWIVVVCPDPGTTPPLIPGGFGYP